MTKTTRPLPHRRWVSCRSEVSCRCRACRRCRRTAPTGRARLTLPRTRLRTWDSPGSRPGSMPPLPTPRPLRRTSASQSGRPVRRPGSWPARRLSSTPSRPVRRRTPPRTDLWVPGGAPSLAGRRAVEAAAKAGSVGIIGVPAGLRRLSDRAGDEQEPDGANGQLQPPPVHPPATRPWLRSPGRPGGLHHPGGEARRGHRGLRELRLARGGLGPDRARGQLAGSSAGPPEAQRASGAGAPLCLHPVPLRDHRVPRVPGRGLAGLEDPEPEAS
jgi:hypothetical protein